MSAFSTYYIPSGFDCIRAIMNVSTLAAPPYVIVGRVTTKLMNTTDDDVPFLLFFDSFALFWQILAPLIFMSGFFGNTMIIVICNRSDVMSSLSVYFVALAGSDLLLVGVNALNLWIYYTFDIDVSSLHTFACKLVGWLVFVGGQLSAWILVAMTAQRAVCVLWPHRANILCSAQNSKAIALSITLFIAVFNCHVLYGLDVVTFIHYSQTTNNVVDTFNGKTHSTNSTVLTLNDGKHTTNSCFNDGKHNTSNTAVIFGDTNTAAVCVVVRDYMEFYFSVWSWVVLLVFSVLPWLCLVVSNCVLLWTLNVSIRQAQHSLGSAHTDGFSGRKKQASSMTVTLLAVSMAFIILNFPLSCVQVLGFYHHLMGTLDVFHQSQVVAYCHEIALALWQTNSVVNFYLYGLTGSKFRNELKQVFRCATMGNKTHAAAPSSTATSSFN